MNGLVGGLCVSDWYVCGLVAYECKWTAGGKVVMIVVWNGLLLNFSDLCHRSLGRVVSGHIKK